jgi:hypothetical protein
MPVSKEILFDPSTIENIDTAVYEWVNQDLDLITNTNTGLKKVPALWLGAERAFQIKNDQRLRDDAGKLILPLIAVHRDSITRDRSFLGTFQGYLPDRKDYKGGAITIHRKINQEKTRNFKNANKKRSLKGGDETGRDSIGGTVYQEITIPTPEYITLIYNIVLRTEYQQQMNDLMTPFIRQSGDRSFMIERNNHRYEVFIEDSLAETKNLESLSEEERMFETKIQIKVLGYLVGDGINNERPKVTIRENRVKLRLTRERVITGDEVPWKTKDKDYRD